MEGSLKSSALEQLSLLLKDPSLHHNSLEEGIVSDLLAVLQKTVQEHLTSTSSRALKTSGSEEKEKDMERNFVRLVSPIFQCLHLLVQWSAELRKELFSDSAFLLTAFTTAVLCAASANTLHHVTSLIAYLVFSPVAPCTITETGRAVTKLPMAFINRFKLPLDVEVNRTDSPHLIAPPLSPEFLSSEPLLSMLRVLYHCAMEGGVEIITTDNKDNEIDEDCDNSTVLQQAELVALKCLNLHSGLGLCFKRVYSALSHYEAAAEINHLDVVIASLHISGVSLGGRELCNWRELLERYLTVHPITANDVSLLNSVLRLLCTLLQCPAHISPLTPSQLSWLTEVTCAPSAVCLQLVQSSLRSDEANDDQQLCCCMIPLQEVVLSFYTLLLQSIAKSTISYFDLGPLLNLLCQCLDVAGSPDYYDLALLESSLECLLHLTAGLKPNKLLKHATSKSLSLYTKLISSLQQVLWSFTCGRGSMQTSFMGKGVTSHASLSLCHLLHHVDATSVPEDFWSQWLQSVPDIGLLWLHSLTRDREQQVRYAGWCILALLCSKCSCVELLLEDCSGHTVFGLWGSGMETALDAQECSLVRQQAFSVLLNISLLCVQHKKWEQYLCYTIDNATLHGLEALQMLLEHFCFWSFLRGLIDVHSLETAKDKLSTAAKAGTALQNSLESQEDQADKVDRGNVSSKSDSDNKVHPYSGTDYSSHAQPFSTSMYLLAGSVVLSCCPPVVSGACRLLHNLLLSFPKLIGTGLHSSGFVISLTSVLDVDFVEVIEGFNSSSFVRMLTDAVTLMNTAVVHIPDTVLPLLSRENIMGRLHDLLRFMGAKLSTEEGNEGGDADHLSLCSALLSLMCAVVKRLPSSSADVVFSTLQMHWSSFTDLLLHSLRPRPRLASLQKHSLRLLSALLTHRCQPLSPREEKTAGKGDPFRDVMCGTINFLLDGKSPFPGECEVNESAAVEIVKVSSGNEICKALISVYDSTAVTAHPQFSLDERVLVVEALRILLACSTTAKQCALKAGLLESCLEQTKLLHTRLCLESLEQQTNKNRDSLLTTELILVIRLLQNLLYHSTEAKHAALSSSLPSTMHKLWPWCTVSRRLLVAVLQLLSVFTAKHSRGQAALASPTRAPNSLLHSVLKLASHTITSFVSCSAARTGVNPHAAPLRAAFTLLANCALSVECRGIMKKAGFLSSFSNTMPKTEKLTSSVRLSHCWLSLLVTLSFFSDGQQMIVKTPGSLEVLLDIYSVGDDTVLCLLVLRNLCFFGPSKTLLASNETFLHVLCESIESGDLESGQWKRAAIAASAVWGLLHNCSRIKSSLRSAGLHNKLESLHSMFQASQSSLSGSTAQRGQPDLGFHLCHQLISKAVSLIH